MAKRTCPKCDSCDHDEPRHHWIEDEDSLTGYSCKHCEAIAVECGACGGSGEGDSLPEEFDTIQACEACQGQGIVEVVAISLEEVKHMRDLIEHEF